MPVNCLELGEEDVTEILKAVLYEFPMQELDLYLPPWVDALPAEHPIKAGLYDAVRQGTGQLRHIREVEGVIAALGESEHISEARISAIDLGTGVAAAALALLQALGALSPLNALSGVYFTQLLANGAESLTLRRQGRPYIFFSIGLFLFIGCDICVGLHNLVPASAAGAFARVGMWMFYLPAQVLITLSGLPNFSTRGVPIEDQ